MAQSCFIEDMETATPFTKVTNNLYMGSQKGLKASGINTSRPFFTIYVSTAKEVKPPKSVPGVFESLWIKMADHPWDYANDPETIRKLVEVTGVIATLTQSGHRVFIFCKMGMNRSGFITALTLMHLGWKLDAALKKIRERHHCTICNESFVDALRFIERTYFRR